MKLDTHGPNGTNVTVRMTDAEAVALIAALWAKVDHRKALIAAEPAMANWDDVAHSNTGEMNGKHAQISISICGV